MTLSNKILVGFFVVVFLYLTAAFTEVRLRGTPNLINDSNSKAEVVDLSGIHYLIVDGVDKNININITQSDRLQLEVRSITGNLLKDLTYEISGDTLTLISFKTESHQLSKITVRVPHDSLQNIFVRSSEVWMSGLEQTQLQVTQNDGSIWMSNCKLTNMTMNLTEKSNINISDTDIDSLSVSIDKSDVQINSLIGFVRGTVTHDSFFRLSGIREIQLKKDESSSLSIF